MAYSPSVSSHPKERVSVATYNCLANEFLYHWNGKLSPQQSAYVTQPQFDDKKQQDVVARIQKLNADVVCVQELSSNNVQAFIFKMAQLGYTGVYEQFDGKPDGIATFIRNGKFKEYSKEVVPYQDGTGRKAVFLHLKTQQGAIVDVANTHLQGGQQNVPVANAEITKLVQKVSQVANPVIVCGDMNFTPMDPRFQTVHHSLADSLNGQSYPTSMNGTTGLRLDYIWHTRSLAPVSSGLSGNLQKFLTQEEPSDHIPVVASFDLDVPQSQPTSVTGVVTRNTMPGTDQSPSFRRKLFMAFNQKMAAMPITQQKYDECATRFEAMLNEADSRARQFSQPFAACLIEQIAFKSIDAQEASELCAVLPLAGMTMPQYHYYNDQPYNNGPSFRHTIFERFNQMFSLQSGNLSGMYPAMAQFFSQVLTLAEQERVNFGGDFLTILSKTIELFPQSYGTAFLSSIVEQFKPSETVVVIKCKDVPSDQELYLRGSGAGLSWSSGVKLKRLDWETFEFRTKTPFSGELEYKCVLNDDGNKWEEGANHKIAQGKKVEGVPSFNVSVLPPLKKTVVEVNCAVPPGKTLYLSGSGPLGNWDRKVPMTCLSSDSSKWFISFDGEFPAFEYKLRLDDNWEQGANRKAECGKKAEIKAFQF